MRKFIGLLLTLVVIACGGNESVKNYASIEGKLKTAGVEKITVQGRNYIKEIDVNEDGSFSDTLVVNTGIHAISNGNDRITLFLKNGYDLELDFKGEQLATGINYKGIGAETNAFMENIRLFYTGEYGNPKTYFELEAAAFKSKLSKAKGLLKSYKEASDNIDSLVVDMAQRNEKFFEYIEENYEQMHADAVRLRKGATSPVFSNYENHKGGTTSLSDLKGKYVYLDIWATWCAPCKAEIPFLKEIEKEYHNKNIEFVSISVDKKEAYDTWKNMVTSENLGGIQLYADKNFESDFIMEYGINAIPRFILVDPEGNIVDANTLRPSNPKLKELFTDLGI